MSHQGLLIVRGALPVTDWLCVLEPKTGCSSQTSQRPLIVEDEPMLGPDLSFPGNKKGRLRRIEDAHGSPIQKN